MWKNFCRPKRPRKCFNANTFNDEKSVLSWTCVLRAIARVLFITWRSLKEFVVAIRGDHILCKEIWEAAADEVLSCEREKLATLMVVKMTGTTDIVGHFRRVNYSSWKNEKNFQSYGTCLSSPPFRNLRAMPDFYFRF